jgi:hypothetical protein
MDYDNDHRCADRGLMKYKFTIAILLLFYRMPMRERIMIQKSGETRTIYHQGFLNSEF